MTRKTILGALASVLVLGACGNDVAFNSDKESIKSRFKHFKVALQGMSGAEPTAVSGDMITATLASNPRPMSVVTIEEKNASGIMSLIDVNGAYRTYGNSSRQAMIFRQGLLTGSRGLGDDLMSSDVGTAGLIHARRAGQAARVSRYLDGEGKTVETRMTCSVSVGGSKTVGLGQVGGPGRVVAENCTPQDGTAIGNSYVVDGQGRVLWSRQWHGPGQGYMVVQPIRL
jgi:hypothetical protein